MWEGSTTLPPRRGTKPRRGQERRDRRPPPPQKDPLGERTPLLTPRQQSRDCGLPSQHEGPRASHELERGRTVDAKSDTSSPHEFRLDSTIWRAAFLAEPGQTPHITTWVYGCGRLFRCGCVAAVRREGYGGSAGAGSCWGTAGAHRSKQRSYVRLRRNTGPKATGHPA